MSRDLPKLSCIDVEFLKQTFGSNLAIPRAKYHKPVSPSDLYDAVMMAFGVKTEKTHRTAGTRGQLIPSELQALLRNGLGWERKAAARSLCLFGMDEGVAILVQPDGK